ncbi:MAG: hypothetical protein Q8Q59_06320 [Luteolibacter sp.]|nr:hypothetical protein [Luteolibacter sp.]
MTDLHDETGITIEGRYIAEDNNPLRNSYYSEANPPFRILWYQYAARWQIGGNGGPVFAYSVSDVETPDLASNWLDGYTDEPLAGILSVMKEAGAPASPLSVQPGGLPPSPQAPVNAAGSGSISAPSHPATVQSGGMPSAPAAPSAVLP